MKVKVIRPDSSTFTYSVNGKIQKSEFGENFLKFFDKDNYVHHINIKYILEITE